MQDEHRPASLEALPAELFTTLAAHLPLSALGRLSSVSRLCASLVNGATEAWDAAWFAATGECRCPPEISAREAVRCLTTLDTVRWDHLPAPALPPDVAARREYPLDYSSGGLNGSMVAPRWREHACALSCNGGRRLILFGGRDARSEPPMYLNDTWMCDLRTGAWMLVARGGPAPSPRCFNTDSGGGRVLRSGRREQQDEDEEEEWAVIFGGLCQPGHRDAQTWLLGPLNETPEQWQWLPAMPDEWAGGFPEARFHHTLTVVPRPPSSTESDFLVMLGGHDRTIRPILSTHLFSLRDASFPWDDDDDTRRRMATVSWVAQPRDPEPCPRGFHGACHWRDPRDDCPFVILSCGLGSPPYVQHVDGFVIPEAEQALDDTYAFDMNSSEWLQLHARLPSGHARSRPALTVARDRLILAGGCRGCADPDRSTFAPGPVFDDVWLLDLQQAIGHEADYRHAARAGVEWERCVLPTDRVHKAPHVNAMAHALHGGAAVLLLGGHYPGKVDSFGDTQFGETWALHETAAIAIGPAAAASKPTHPQARMCTDGMPHFHDHSDEAVNARNGTLIARRSTRVLVHSLQGQRSLNGAVGTITGIGYSSDGRDGVMDIPNMMDEADSRVGVALGPPHNKSVAIRRRNLQASRCVALGDTPIIVQPSCADESACVWALTPAMGFARRVTTMAAPKRHRKDHNEQMRNGIGVSRLTVLPWDAGAGSSGGEAVALE